MWVVSDGNMLSEGEAARLVDGFARRHFSLCKCLPPTGLLGGLSPLL